MKKKRRLISISPDTEEIGLKMCKAFCERENIELNFSELIEKLILDHKDEYLSK